MSHKTFKCTICGTEITKPQSYAHNGGRACRHHQEAVASNTERVEAQQDAAEAYANQQKTPWHRTGPIQSPDEMLDQMGYKNPRKTCWHCGASGVEVADIAFRMLVNMSKAEVEGTTFNPFVREKGDVYEMTSKDLGLDTKVPIKRFPIPESYPDWKLKQLVTQPSTRAQGAWQQLARMSQQVCLCPKCAKTCQFDWHYDAPKKYDLHMLAVLGQVGRDIGLSIAVPEVLDRISREGPRK
jgi:hypothetical protein